MEKEQQILNWLMEGLSKHPGLINEIFYYDKSDQQFFSILWMDYMLLEDHNGMAHSYSEESVKLLKRKILRLENSDADIIRIPSISLDERKMLLTQFLRTLNDSSLSTQIEKKNLDEKWSKFIARLELEASQTIIDRWKRFKYPILRDKAASFLNLNGINLLSAEILEIEAKSSFTFDLTGGDESEDKHE